MARKGAQSSEVRAQLVEAANQLIREHGCHAVTAGRLAERVGLKRQIVHYYFGTIDELFVAVLQQEGEKARARFVQALDADQPLRTCWEQANNASAHLLEFMAIAMHSESVKRELTRYADEFRDIQTEALRRYLERRGVAPSVPPVVTALIMASISQAFALEEALGISKGHAETLDYIEEVLSAFEATGKSFATAQS